MAKPYLSVIIPTKNDSDRLPITLIDLDKYLEKFSFDYEIIVVDCNSKDGTVGIAKKFEDIIPNLSVIESDAEGNNLIRASVGLFAASGNYRLFVRVDNAISIDAFLDMMPYLEGGDGANYDVIVGSRFIDSREPGISLKKRIYLWLKKVVIRLGSIRGIDDAASGFVCFSENISMNLEKSLNHPAGIIELLLVSRLLGSRIKNVSVGFTNTSLLSKDLSDTLGSFKEVLGTKFSLAFKKYVKFK